MNEILETQAVQATRADLARHAREHYERLSAECCDWCSTIPPAIDAWEREPVLRKRLERSITAGDAMHDVMTVLFSDPKNFPDPDQARQVWVAMSGWTNALVGAVDAVLALPGPTEAGKEMTLDRLSQRIEYALRSSANAPEDDARLVAGVIVLEADRKRLEEAEWREKLQAKVMESQENLLVAYRVGMTGERVGRIIDKLQDAKAKLAALAPQGPTEAGKGNRHEIRRMGE